MKAWRKTSENSRTSKGRPRAVGALASSTLGLAVCLALFSSWISPSVSPETAMAAQKSSFILIPPGEPEENIVRTAAGIVPTENQLAWQEMEFIAFAHFGMNTFTDREWGEGTESPALFNPTDFDARQWVRVLREAGVRMLILTAKHHDGFCLWPSRYTNHSVKSSPWRGGRGDVVKEVADACREAGLKAGIYVSPWDRHEPSYGDSPAYNQQFRNQLRELLSNYGEISEVWFDGACGEGRTASARSMTGRPIIALSGNSSLAP